MFNIRPVSDLRNKYPEIEKLVLEEEQAVYLTKNGYGSMVVMSIDKYTDLLEKVDQEKYLETKFGSNNIDNELEKIEQESNQNDAKYYTQEQFLDIARRTIDE